jgi:hypothetical protein
VRTFLACAVWPSVWPAVVALGLLAVLRGDVRNASLLDCAAYSLATVATYAALFWGVAIGREDRRRYVTKLRSITGLPALNAAA